MNKYCQGCETEHPIDNFNRRSSTKDGRQSYCRDYHTAVALEWASVNRDRRNATERAYIARTNVTKVRDANRRVKHGPRLTVAGWAQVQKRQDYLCNLCQVEPISILDHVVPVSAGGSNRLHNIQGLCVGCNKAKNRGEWRGKALWKAAA
jgi:5-methylcytosine-specific restriction endonuclease McrA